MAQPDYIICRPTREGLKIRIPGNPQRVIPEKGCRIRNDTFAQRRIADGDLEIVPDGPVSAKKTSAKPAESAKPPKGGK